MAARGGTVRRTRVLLVLRDVVQFLRCPVCEGEPSLDEATLSCPAGHSFDVSRQGYVNLLPGDARPGTADTAAMVAARAEFLAAGHFDPIAEAVSRACRELSGDGPVLDVGAGTGFYLARSLERLPGRPGIALDISKHAARRAAGAHPRIGAVVCDAWRALPVRSAAAGAVLSVFSPRNGAEMRRVVRHDGTLIVVSPRAEHLRELVDAAGLLHVDERKGERLVAQLGGHFEIERRHEVVAAISLGHADLERLVRMGPSARHIDPAAARERVAALPDPTAVTAAVTVSAYRPR